MLTSDNIYRIDFEEAYGCVMVPKTVIFNVTQISEEEVRNAIKNDVWEDEPRIIAIHPKQLKYLQDKEEKETIHSLRRQAIDKFRDSGIDIAKVLGGPSKPNEMKWRNKED